MPTGLAQRLTRDAAAVLDTDGSGNAQWFNELVTYVSPAGASSTFQAAVDRTDLAAMNAGRRTEQFQSVAGEAQAHCAILYCNLAQAVAPLGIFTLADGSRWGVERQHGVLGKIASWFIRAQRPVTTRGARGV